MKCHYKNCEYCKTTNPSASRRCSWCLNPFEMVGRYQRKLSDKEVVKFHSEIDEIKSKRSKK